MKNKLSIQLNLDILVVFHRLDMCVSQLMQLVEHVPELNIILKKFHQGMVEFSGEMMKLTDLLDRDYH